MELDIDFVTYMWVIGTLMVLVAVIGAFVVPASFREHNRRREEKMGYSRQGPLYWNADNPEGFGHR